MAAKGVVAAGHEASAEAAEQVLRAGGNAFDAAIAAFFAACVCEPVLASLGGGGFLLARTGHDVRRVYDFFVQTPLHKRASADLDFYPIQADFGTEQQCFHIGLGSIATPGAARGLFEVHRDLGTMPMRELAAPAIALAREGVVQNALQSAIADIIAPILTASAGARDLYGQASVVGARFVNPDFADALEVLSIEGDDLFYRGEIGQSLVRLCREGGGHLQAQDLADYQVLRREPLHLQYRNTRISVNPPPACGGVLIAFALKLLQSFSLGGFHPGDSAYLDLLAQVMAQTDRARLHNDIDNPALLLDEPLLDVYRQCVLPHAPALRGTTHISVMDAAGNTAALSVSNGEGCGTVLQGSGIMPNNMLGEQDLSPQGFDHWRVAERMTSMMSPTLVEFADGRMLALGSGGSNRIRTAILQTLIHVIDFKMPIQSAVHHPRIHFENTLLSIEAGAAQGDQLTALLHRYAKHQQWDALNLFFGGVHAVMRDGGALSGVGDPRRGGVCRLIGW